MRFSKFCFRIWKKDSDNMIKKINQTNPDRIPLWKHTKIKHLHSNQIYFFFTEAESIIRGQFYSPCGGALSSAFVEVLFLANIRIFFIIIYINVSHEKNNTVVKVTPPSKNMVLLFGQPEKVVISISPPS